MAAPRKPEDPSGLELDDREIEILKSVIREHVLSGEPIGSRTVSRGTRLDLSPASIRNTMAALAERGLLSQPHPSAGRVPTPQAYRLYVDRLMERPRMARAQAEAIDRALLRSRGEIAELLAAASRQLSRFSHQVGVVLAPELSRVVIEQVEFIRLDDRRVVAVIVARSGVVNNRLLEIDEAFEQSELDGIGRYLSEEFGGRTLPEIRADLEKRMSEERADYDRLLARSLELGRKAVDAESREPAVYVDGAANLLEAPEFADLERMKSLMRSLDERRALIELLGRVLEGEGTQVVIGDEHPAGGLASCSLVASTYGHAGRVIGTVGIFGPTRMEYARAVALVDYLARVLSGFFSGPGN